MSYSQVAPELRASEWERGLPSPISNPKFIDQWRPVDLNLTILGAPFPSELPHAGGSEDGYLKNRKNEIEGFRLCHCVLRDSV